MTTLPERRGPSTAALKHLIHDYLADGWRAATASEIAAAVGVPLRDVARQLSSLESEHVARRSGEDERGRLLWALDLSDDRCDLEPSPAEVAAIEGRIAQVGEAKREKARLDGVSQLLPDELDAVLPPRDCARTRHRLARAAGGAA